MGRRREPRVAQRNPVQQRGNADTPHGEGNGDVVQKEAREDAQEQGRGVGDDAEEVDEEDDVPDTAPACVDRADEGRGEGRGGADGKDNGGARAGEERARDRGISLFCKITRRRTVHLFMSFSASIKETVNLMQGTRFMIEQPW